MNRLDVVLEFAIFAIFVYAIVDECNAISENNGATTKAQKIAIEGTPCDMIGSAAQLNATSERKLSVGWRRAVIASTTLSAISPYALNMSLTTQQKVGLYILTFFTFLSVEGFSNYYFSNATSLAIDSNLQLAIRTFDQQTCDPDLQYQSLRSWLRPLES
jgi:hypothetical protein